MTFPSRQNNIDFVVSSTPDTIVAGNFGWLLPSIYGSDLIKRLVRKACSLDSEDPEFVAKTSDMVSHNKLGTGYTLKITRAKQKFFLVV